MEEQNLKKTLEENRQRFLTAIAEYRPKLHKYCSHMIGSVFDGEDVVQETLAQAYYRLSQLKHNRPVEPWLFRIAHNKCIDFLRRRKNFVYLQDNLEHINHTTEDAQEISDEVKQALTLLIQQLPAMERACVMLKDVLEYSLLEIADIVGTTSGAVKSALHRGRGKLKAMSALNENLPASSEKEPLILLYADRFNRKDWQGLRKLIRQDARLEVVGTAEVLGRDQIEAKYFGNYKKLEIPWHFTVGSVDGEKVLICWRFIENSWVARTAIQLVIEDNLVIAIKDYIYVDYLLKEANIISPDPSVINNS